MVQTNSLIDNIASFTSHRDQDLLDFSLLKSIKKMLSAPKVMSLVVDKQNNLNSKMENESGCFYTSDNIGESEKIVLEHIKKMRLLALDEQLIETSKGFIYLRLLHDNRILEQYLIVHLHKRMDKTQSLVLGGILSIYNNFLSLLKDSQTDELTGLANRKTFESEIAKVIERIAEETPQADSKRDSDKNQQPPQADSKRDSDKNQEPTSLKVFWIAVIDIDNFKSVNDTYGHLYGDEILIQMAQIIRSSFRQQDLQFRFGGEEFVVILEAQDKDHCINGLDRFRLNVASHNFPSVGSITVSIGAVQIQKDVFRTTLLDYADQALYQSKRTGKNKVTLFEDMLEQGIAKKESIESGEIDLF